MGMNSKAKKITKDGLEGGFLNIILLNLLI